MASTTISVNEEAYKLLKRVKRKGESFSDVIIEHVRPRVARLAPEIAYEAAAIDRELMRAGERLGENDNWIAGFARYYREPIVSSDQAFDRVPGIRRISYWPGWAANHQVSRAAQNSRNVPAMCLAPSARLK